VNTDEKLISLTTMASLNAMINNVLTDKYSFFCARTKILR